MLSHVIRVVEILKIIAPQLSKLLSLMSAGVRAPCPKVLRATVWPALHLAVGAVTSGEEHCPQLSEMPKILHKREVSRRALKDAEDLKKPGDELQAQTDVRSRK
jgi:hypothetical protein